MKRLLSVIIPIIFVLPAFSQPDTIKVVSEKGKTEKSNDPATRVIIGNKAIVVEDLPGKTVIRIGDRGLEILEDLEGDSEIVFKNYAEDEFAVPQKDEKSIKKKKRGSNRYGFKGHWAGVDLGFNNYLSAGYAMDIPDEISYMNLNAGRSVNVNINFSQLSIGLTRRIGFVTGLGLHINNYVFEGNNNITKGTDGVIAPLYPSPGIRYEKSKLVATYLTAPFLFEIQIPASHYRHLDIAAGPVGGIRLGSHTKTMHYNGGKQKEKEHGGFNLGMFRYGFTGSVGYGIFSLYSTCYMTSLFRNNRGPELYPFELGVRLNFFD